MKKIIISDPIFDRYPDFYRGVVLVRDITNQPSYKRIRKLLREQIESRAEQDLEKDDRLRAWDEAHEKFGSDPRAHPPSIRALWERIKKSPNLPFINSVVALFNYTSLKYVLPCGGDDVDKVEGNLVLGLARGDETFQPLGGGEPENPSPGEVIYYDDASGNVLCRRWNWRNGERTKIEVESKRLVINVDGLPPITPDDVERATAELSSLLQAHCNGVTVVAALQDRQRSIEIPES